MVTNSARNHTKSSSLELACAKIAHEIKNPIAIIASTLQLVELQLPEVKSTKHWNKLYHELEYMSALLSDFNALSQINQSDFKEMDLGELISEVYERFEPLAISKGVSFTLDLPAELYNIYGDEVKLMEAFVNLLKNAVEAVKIGGHVHLGISSTNGLVSVTVEDDGCGIQEEQLNCIFHPFISYKENGTGLGLPIVASIIDAHQGFITVESTISEGTTFIVKLPLLIL